MDSQADLEDSRWLTLAELAEFRGIDKLSAARLVRRRGWRRQKDNEGRVRALVPSKWIEGHEDGPPDRPADSPVDLSHAIRALESSIASLTTARDQAEARANRAEQKTDLAKQEADLLRNRLETAEIETRQARIEVEQLRQAEAARKGRGRWARVRAAWLGK